MQEDNRNEERSDPTAHGFIEKYVRKVIVAAGLKLGTTPGAKDTKRQTSIRSVSFIAFVPADLDDTVMDAQLWTDGFAKSLLEIDPKKVIDGWHRLKPALRSFEQPNWPKLESELTRERKLVVPELAKQERAIAPPLPVVTAIDRAMLVRGFRELAAQFRTVINAGMKSRFDGVELLRMGESAGGLLMRAARAGAFASVPELDSLAREYDAAGKIAPDDGELQAFKGSPRRLANLFRYVVGEDFLTVTEGNVPGHCETRGILPALCPEMFDDPIKSPAFTLPETNEETANWEKVRFRRHIHLSACACDLLADIVGGDAVADLVVDAAANRVESDRPAISDMPRNLTDAQRDIWNVVVDGGHRMTTKQIQAALDRKGIPVGESAIKQHLALFTQRLGCWDNRRSGICKGYGFPWWES